MELKFFIIDLVMIFLQKKNIYFLPEVKPQ